MEDPIYVRTLEGQREVGAEGTMLSPVQRRLLLLVNGYTELAHFAERLGHAALRAEADVLLALGLITDARLRPPLPPPLPLPEAEGVVVR